MPLSPPEIPLQKWARFMAWLIIPAIVVCSPLYWFFSYGMIPGPGPQSGDEVRVVIPQGQGFQGVYQALVDSGVIAEDARFGLLASWRGISKKLKAGEYAFQRPVPPSRVLDSLVAGSSLHHPLTFQEGLTMRQVVRQLSRRGWGGQQELLALCSDPDFIESLGLDVPTLEGYLFPDTYYFSRDQGGRAILRMMVSRFFEVARELGLVVRSGQAGDVAASHSLSLHEIVTLASIVEKEAGVAVERPMVARVFLNRLERNMRLQADPTVIYGLSDFDGNLTRQDLRTPSAYNTYLLKGLPFGPIANPGRHSLQAVLEPAEGNWTYFVSRGDGTHHFSTNLTEHNRAVYEFQKKR